MLYQQPGLTVNTLLLYSKFIILLLLLRKYFHYGLLFIILYYVAKYVFIIFLIVPLSFTFVLLYAYHIFLNSKYVDSAVGQSVV